MSVQGTVAARITADHTANPIAAVHERRLPEPLIRYCGRSVQPLHDFVGRVRAWRRPGDGVGVEDDIDAGPLRDIREDGRELRAKLVLQSQLA